MEVRARAQSKTKGSGSAAYERVAGFKKKGLFAGRRASKQLEEVDFGVLANASYDDLMALAISYGIDIKKKESIGSLKT